MGAWARWRASRQEARAEQIAAAARADDEQDAQAARDRLLGRAPNRLPDDWMPTDRVGDWTWDGSGWRHKWNRPS